MSMDYNSLIGKAVLCGSLFLWTLSCSVQERYVVVVSDGGTLSGCVVNGSILVAGAATLEDIQIDAGGKPYGIKILEGHQVQLVNVSVEGARRAGVFVAKE